MLTALAIDWSKLLTPTVGLPELVLRGSVVYLAIFAVLRFFRREAGELGTADVLVVVLVADAAQNAMAAEYHSLTEGLVLIATIFGWNFLIDWLAFKYEWAHRILQPQPLLLIKHGRLVPRNLRAEMLTKEDLAGMLRQHGIEHFSEVKRCYLEAEGRISVIKRQGEEGSADRQPSRRA